VKHTIYKDPKSGKFAWVVVPPRFIKGDKLRIPQDVRWFDSREQAVAAAPDLLSLDE
jgi:hypothetical protein